MGFRSRIRALVSRRDTTAAPAAPTSAPTLESETAERLATRLDSSIVNTITGLGGVNDKGAAARPQTREPLTDAELATLYLDNGIARRVVDIVPAEATRKGWQVMAKEQGMKREVVAAAVSADQTLHTLARVQEAWALARLWGHALVVMVTDDEIPSIYRGDPGRWLATPLDINNVKQVTALQVFDAMESFPLAYDTDMRSDTFRQPSMWGLAPSIPGAGADRIPSQVHASRVLYFGGRPRPPSLRYSFGHRLGSRHSLDDSVIRAAWDEIRNLTQTMAGGATLAQELRESVLKVGGLRGMATADQAEEVRARLRLMGLAKSLLGILVLGEHDEYANNSNPPTGFRELSSEAQAMLSGVTGIPLTILFGHAPTGLSTDDKSGRQAWDRQIRSEYICLDPKLVKLYSTVFGASEGPFRGDTPVGLRVLHPPLIEESQGEQADTYKTVAEGDAIYIDRGVVPPEQIGAARFSADGWSLEVPAEELDEDETEDQEPTAEELAQAQAELEAEAAAGSVEEEIPVSESLLNGAQLQQARELMTQVYRGEMPRPEVVATMQVLFGLDPEQAERVVPQPNPSAFRHSQEGA